MNSVNLSQPLVARDRHKIQGGQGVMLSIQEWGNPNGQPILFAHAFAMSHLDFLPQFTSHLASEFRLITFDHRGHGESEKPDRPEAGLSALLCHLKQITMIFQGFQPSEVAKKSSL
jgi:pimeloyl-ACP methyl ester carboxylesterase